MIESNFIYFMRFLKRILNILFVSQIGKSNSCLIVYLFKKKTYFVSHLSKTKILNLPLDLEQRVT